MEEDEGGKRRKKGRVKNKIEIANEELEKRRRKKRKNREQKDREDGSEKRRMKMMKGRIEVKKPRRIEEKTEEGARG